MNPVPRLLAIPGLLLCLLSLPLPEASGQDGPIRLNDKGYFETRGFNVLAFENACTGFFFDEKTSGVMLIQHGVRTATGGAVRLKPTPEQWDQIPVLVDRKVNRQENSVEIVLRYGDFDFNSKLLVRADGNRIIMSVLLDKPLPDALEGRAGNDTIIRWSITNYLLHKAFPDLIGPEYTYRGIGFLYGCHPYSNVSFVSGIGVHSKKIAYGNNRADYSFIAGGVVPGVLVIPPDFPENKDDWPFFWGENEYVIDINAEYVFLVHAVHALGLATL
jgi:hypothetical protein